MPFEYTPHTHISLHCVLGVEFICYHNHLYYSGCDVNSPRRPGPGGQGDEEARDGMGPLHLAATWGLEQLVQCLVEFNADVNIQVITSDLMTLKYSNVLIYKSRRG